MSIGKRSRRQVSAIRKDVFFRDRYRCVVLSAPWSTQEACSGDLTVQHAVARGMGGSARWDGIQWLRTMCWGHNTLEPRDADFRRQCEIHGWSIPRWVAERFPCDRIPVWLNTGWHVFTDTGWAVPISRESALRFGREIYGPGYPGESNQP